MKQWMLLLAFLPLPPVHAADVVFKVNLAQDAPDAAPGDGICSYNTDLPPESFAVCSLRAAVMEANATDIDEDAVVEIELNPGSVYSLSIEGVFDQDAAKGDLDIQRPMALGVPAGAMAKAKIASDTGDRVFQIDAGAFGSSLFGLEISGGIARAPSGGGGIYNAASDVVVDWVVVSGIKPKKNEHIEGFAIMNLGSMRLLRSDIRFNGLFQSGQLEMVGSYGPNSSLTMEKTSVRMNWGTGVATDSVLNVDNSLIAENWPGDCCNSPAIGVLIDAGAVVAISNTTIAENSSAGLLFPITNEPILASLKLVNSIVLDGGVGQSNACYTPNLVPITGDWNVFGDDSCASAIGPNNVVVAPDVIGLSAVKNWGGPTPSKRPSETSPTIDRTPAEFCGESDTDQRGMPRVVARNGVPPARCDTGSFEMEAGPPDYFANGFRDGFEEF